MDLPALILYRRNQRIPHFLPFSRGGDSPSCTNRLVNEAIEEGIVDGSVVAFDASHIHARDQGRSFKSKQPPQTDQVVMADDAPPAVPEAPSPRKRGRKPKAEREQWFKEKAEREAAQSPMEKSLQDMAENYTLEEILKAIPTNPEWGRKQTTNKPLVWFGYKVHVDVDTKSQYILWRPCFPPAVWPIAAWRSR